MGLNKKEAIALAETKWWEDKTLEEICDTQMAEPLLICPWSVFHKAVEHRLGRPVFTHEFAFEKLKDEWRKVAGL